MIMDIEQSVKTYTFEDGEIQRVQMVKMPSWECLDFFSCSFSKEAFDGVIDVIDRFQVQRYPMLFGTMVFFHIPKDLDVPFSFDPEKYGKVNDKNVKASILFKERFKNERFVPANNAEKSFVESLKAAGTFRILKGLLKKTVPMPFSDNFGRMSSVFESASFKVNSNFFIMDSFDCASVYDSVGTPLGLCIKNGKAVNLPLYEREALVVRKSGVSVEMPRLKDCSFVIGKKEYVPGMNCRVYERPSFRITGRCFGTDIVIVGTKVMAVKHGGKTVVPGGGFVLQTNEKDTTVEPGSDVSLNGFDDVLFSVQTGNSIVKNGWPSGGFISKFYNIKKLFSIPYPPCFYPLDYGNARAARIAIGADKDDRPCILWAEGAAKIGHEKGSDSRGASLYDMERFCIDLGIENAVNLDGGGSAQILLTNKRSLFISDRKKDGSENERGVPLGIMVN